MKATVTQSFPGRPDDQADTREIAEGEVITGDLAAVAIRENWAVEIVDDSPAAIPAADFTAMTVDELKAYAADRQIDLSDAKLKADIVAAIVAAEKQ
jgi:hypothetical protein